MDQPVRHNCLRRGTVSNVIVNGEKVPVCDACQQRITDARELSPRGTGFQRETSTVAYVNWGALGV